MLLAIAVLVVLSAAGQVAKHFFGYPHVLGMVEYFNLNNESNPPTWYQALALLATAAAAAVVALQEKSLRSGYWRHWAGIALVFVYLSADEGAMIHEAAIDPLQRLIHIQSGMWAPTWVMLALPAVAVVAALYVRFFFVHLSVRERVETAAAGLLFVGGAIGMEMGSAAVVFSEGYDPNHRDRLVFAIMAHTEEIMEMLSVVVFIRVLLRRLERRVRLNLSLQRR